MRMLEKHYDTITKDMPDEVKKRIVPVDITGASRWFYEESDQDVWDWEEDFATILPPWELCWIEFKQSKKHRLGQEVRDVAEKVAILGDVGFLVTRISLDPDQGIEALEHDFMLDLFRMRKNADTIPGATQLRRKTIDRALSNGFECRYIMIILTFIINRRGIFKHSMGFYLNKWGKPISVARCVIIDPQWGDLIRQIPDPATRTKAAEQCGEMIAVMSFPVAFAFSLMHCKNVSLDDIVIPPGVAKKRQKKGLPSITFKTLVIDPMRNQVKSEVQNNGNEDTVKKALHICRGHFKDYRQTGLFGKLYDVYWWEQHLRGSADAGVIVKDYAVKEPK